LNIFKWGELMKTEDKVYEIAKPLSNELGYEMVDIEYMKEGKNWFLRIYIDKPSGVSLDDCTLFSEKLGDLLDSQEKDPIPQAYYLEVSSPGAEKPLKTETDIDEAVGEYIHVSLYQQIGPHNSFEGRLKEVTDKEITLTTKVKTRTKDVQISKDNISKARLAIEF